MKPKDYANFYSYDFETFSQSTDAVVSCLAHLCGKWEDYFPEDFENISQEELINSYNKLREDVEVTRVDTRPQQEKYNRRVSKSTLEWWKKYPEALELVKSIENKIQPEELYDFMRDYLVAKNYHDKYTRVYIRAPHFDHPILLSQLRATSGATDDFSPYGVWNVRDTRSVIDTFCGTWWGYPKEKEALLKMLGVVKHDPRDDVAFDIVLLYLSGEMGRCLSQSFNQ